MYVSGLVEWPMLSVAERDPSLRHQDTGAEGVARASRVQTLRSFATSERRARYAFAASGARRRIGGRR